MDHTLKSRIKETIRANPGSVIHYHERREWCIYVDAAESGDDELLSGNDSRDVEGFSPELVAAMAEMLGIRVRSGRFRNSTPR